MPLRARVAGQDILSLDLSSDEFAALRGRQDITMACCDARAIPKRSVTGLPFFAHGRTAFCDAASETEFHLRGKVLIRDAAAKAGWKAQVEVSGEAPSGERWRADVLCEKGERQVAFELQHSGITLARLSERQQRYRESGVGGMWFMRTHERRLREPQTWQRHTPALYITEQHQIPDLDLPLEEVVSRALQDGLILFPSKSSLMRLTVFSHTYYCRYCRKYTAVLARVFLSPLGRPGFSIEIPWDVQGIAQWACGILERNGVSEYPLIQREMYRTGAGSSYGCNRCGKIIFVHQRPRDAADVWREKARQEKIFEQYASSVSGESLALRAITLLSPAENQWFKENVGGRWIPREWLVEI